MGSKLAGTLGLEADNNSISEKKPYATLLALTLGGLVVFVGTWFASQHLGKTFAQLHSEREARLWADKAVSLLANGEQAFTSTDLSDVDKQALDNLLNASAIYRHVLFGSDGKVFWSSKDSKIGKVEGRAYFGNVVAKGHVYTKHAIKPANEIDGFLTSRTGAGIDTNAERQVTEIYVPVMKNGQFSGAMEVYLDVTDLLAWYNDIGGKASVVLCAVVAIIFLIVGALVWSYGRERSRNAKALMKARDEAVTSGTQARRMAEELQEVNDDVVKLNRDLEANMKMLSAAQDEIIRKGKMAQLGQLTATVAHEIRNPLSVVQTSAFLIERKFKGSNPGIEKPLARIKSGITRCDGIITELLDFARSRSLQLQDVDLDDWLTSIVREQAERLPEQVAIECQLGLNGAKVAFDPDRMSRAIINFMSNASEAMVGKGKDTPEEPTADPRIVISTAMSSRGIEVSVTDNGPGISEENISKIREPLFTTKSFGVGLGLPAVEKIFEQHGGGMEISSSPGSGAMFTGWFPLAQEVQKAA